MTDSEKLDLLLDEMSSIKSQISSIENSIGTMTVKQDIMKRKQDDLQLDVQIAERDIRRDIKHLQDTTETLVTILQMREMLPKAN